MSKFSKILAVLMSVCLLFGATTAFLASAEGGAATLGGKGGDIVGTDGTTLTSNSNRTPLGKSYNASRDLRDFDYVVIDMDITPPEGKTYLSGMKFNAQTQAQGKTDAMFCVFYIVKSGDSYYASTKSSGSDFPEDAKLSGIPGVYDHLTFVYQVNKSEDGLVSSITSLLYVNGKYVGQLESTAVFAEAVSFTRLSIQKPSGTGAWTDGTGLTFKTTASLYASNGEKAEALKSVVDAKAPLYTSLSDAIVYNAYTTLPDVDYVLSVDGKKTCFPEAAPALLATVENDSVVEAFTDVTDFDVPDGVESFKLKYDPEKTVFEFSEEDAGTYLILKAADGTYNVCVVTEEDMLPYKYVLKYGDAEFVVNSETLVYLMTPKTNIEFSVFNFADMKLYTGAWSEWTIDVDGDVDEKINLLPPEAIRAISRSEAALIKEEFEGIVTVYNTAEEGSLEVTDLSDCKYIAGYNNNGVFTPILDSNGGYDNYKDLATLDAEKATWDDENVVYYLLENGNVVVPEGSVTSSDALWNVPTLETANMVNSVAAAGVTDLVKSSFKGNGTVDGYGILIIR